MSEHKGPRGRGIGRGNRIDLVDRQFLEKKSENNPQNHTLNAPEEKVRVGWAPGAGRGRGVAKQENTRKVKIPSECAGMVIGKAGAKIRKLKEVSGANINVPIREKRGAEVEVELSGTREQINKAQELIEKLTQTGKHKDDSKGASGGGGTFWRSANYGAPVEEDSRFEDAEEKNEQIDWGAAVRECNEAQRFQPDMNGAKANIVDSMKTYGRESSSDDVKMDPNEKMMIIERYEKVLDFLKSVQMEKGADLAHIRNPLDQLESNLKYIPNGPLFNDIFPTEIKNYILNLSQPCDNRAYIAASVCQEWKRVLKIRFQEKKVILGKCGCQGKDCVKTEEMLRAAEVHKMDSHLIICKPVTEVDSKLLADALTSVSKFTIMKEGCFCRGYSYLEILSDDQADYLFESIATGDKIMEEVNLMRLDLRKLNQETLANCLVSKIKKLKLSDVDFNKELFMAKLQGSTNLNLTHLILSLRINVPNPNITADALCNVENVVLKGSISNQIMQRLMENMLRMPIKMKSLITDQLYHVSDFRYLNPEHLKTVFNQMETLRIKGLFTEDQMETIRSAPDVEVTPIENGYIVEKVEFVVTVESVKKGELQVNSSSGGLMVQNVTMAGSQTFSSPVTDLWSHK